MAGYTVLGEVVVDRIHIDGKVQDIPGGSAANCALALSKIAPDVKFLARFSTDQFGELLFQTALSNGLDVSDAVRCEQPATLVNVRLKDDGSPNYEFLMDGSADWHWRESELAKHDLTTQSAFIYGSLAAILDESYNTLQSWLAANKHQNLLIAYDPNARPTAIAKEQADLIRNRILELVKSANVVKVSDEDLNWIAPNSDPLKIASSWSQLGPELVVLTKGSDGACAFRNGICIANVPGIKTQVIDTVGAGDTLMAWLIAGLVELPENQRFNAGLVESALRKAVKAAAITCSRKGCNPPELVEVS